ncbi:MAG: N-acetylmuramoyl-L-alanine amidase, partial [Bacteroidota bacterium]|nr:N-acetylmuramoyl-L-alanine amidase [Bacteroidota bacterium]
MRYTAINLLEEKLRQAGNSGEYTLQKISIPVPNENLKLEGYLCTPHNRSGYYYSVEHPKQRIVLHYTAGSLRSDLFTLSSHNRHVSVPFVIARDGTIYQLFSSKFWSGHLGKGLGNTNTNNAQDKCSIGIEISNYGFLSEKSGNLETYYSRLKNSNGVPGPVDVYCSLTEREAYEKLNTPFRQQIYYAAYTEAQYESLIILLRYLTARYNIPRQFLPESIRYQATNEVLNFKGIVTHINYRVDGKWDIGPAFNWKKLIDGVQAAEFKPTIHRGAATRGVENALGSEQELDSLLPEAKDPALENEPYEEVQRTSGDGEELKDTKQKRGIKSKDKKQEKDLPGQVKKLSKRERSMTHLTKSEPPNDFRESLEGMPPPSINEIDGLESTGSAPGDLPSGETVINEKSPKPASPPS